MSSYFSGDDLKYTKNYLTLLFQKRITKNMSCYNDNNIINSPSDILNLQYYLDNPTIF